MEGDREQVCDKTLGHRYPWIIQVWVFLTQAGVTSVREGLLDIWVASLWSPVPPLTNDRPDIFRRVTLLLLVMQISFSVRHNKYHYEMNKQSLS